MSLNYNGGSALNPSGVDAVAQNSQLQTFYWLKKSLIEARKEQYFMPLASTTGMPKHYGKTIKLLEYVPLLDERNLNDQGIDANGVTMEPSAFTIVLPSASMTLADNAAATAAAAAINAVEAGVATVAGAVVTVTKTMLQNATAAEEATLLAAVPFSRSHPAAGNLYGSSKDIGTIVGKLPKLTEHGGRVNRVGFTRLELEGSIEKFGFFYEFTKESLDFDSDSELKGHLARELVNGAVQLTEAVLQVDLLHAATTVVYAGEATSNATMTGESGSVESEVSYGDLMRLDQILNDNRTPTQTRVITGSRLVDTKVVPACRVMFVGSELVPTLRGMKDLFGNPAFIGVQHYADAGNVLNGEIGTIDAFRIIRVPEMLHWAGEGAVENTNPGYRATNGRYDVFPMLVVGDDSFTTIGFQTDGKSAKFDIITKMPGIATADRTDPYGEKGFSSIKWYYGILVKRSERLGLIKTIARV